MKICYLLIAPFFLLCACSTKELPKNHFELAKMGQLISDPQNMLADDRTYGAYYTSLVKMDGFNNFPYEYALYFSTDHSIGKGGIWLYMCNGDITQKENWISYEEALAQGKFDYLENKPKGNPIFIDTIQGTQTETPYANIVDGKVYMTYHNVLPERKGQATMMSTSGDGVNFTRIDEDNSIILPVRAHLNHTGYFRWGENRFESVDFEYVGYSLLKGTDDYRSGMWGSNDAINWQQVEMFNSTETNLSMPESDKYLIWHCFDPNSVQKVGDDEYVALVTGGTRASGSAKRVTEIYEIALTADGRTLRHKSKRALSIADKGLDTEELCSPSIVFEGDSVKMVYVGVTNSGKVNTVMAAKGIFNNKVTQLPVLHPEQQQAHFYTKEDFEKDASGLK